MIVKAILPEKLALFNLSNFRYQGRYSAVANKGNIAVYVRLKYMPQDLLTETLATPTSEHALFY